MWTSPSRTSTTPVSNRNSATPRVGRSWLGKEPLPLEEPEDAGPSRTQSVERTSVDRLTAEQDWPP